MLLNGFNYQRDGTLEEENHSIEVEFRAKQVKEDVLAIAFVELRDDVGHLVLHGKGAGSVREGRHHVPDI